jgi:hypothetical protein
VAMLAVCVRSLAVSFPCAIAALRPKWRRG